MIVISNGFNKFHLAVAARAVDGQGGLTALITGAYPYRSLQVFFRRLGIRPRRLEKFYDRWEAMDEAKVYACFGSEAFYFAQYVLRPIPGFGRIAAWVDRTSFRLYGSESVLQLKKAGRQAQIFHYRSGFGHAAARRARSQGMLLVCDHSIAHPAILDLLIARAGRLPESEKAGAISAYWQGAAEDIGRADYTLVNSDFVRETFLRAGYPAERIEVIYWGVDESFFRESQSSSRRIDAGSGPLRLVYAGSFERRKGALELLHALRALPGNWTLDLAGQIVPDMADAVKPLLARSNVRWHGALRRNALARLMREGDVFVFPSLAEGSARVVFEAMACGCAVITTPNAGSVVEHGIHGWLVPPGDPDQLCDALREAIADRRYVSEAGERNAALIESSYREEHYGKKLMAFYRTILRSKQMATSAIP